MKALADVAGSLRNRTGLLKTTTCRSLLLAALLSLHSFLTHVLCLQSNFNVNMYTVHTCVFLALVPVGSGPKNTEMAATPATLSMRCCGRHQLLQLGLRKYKNDLCLSTSESLPPLTFLVPSVVLCAVFSPTHRHRLIDLRHSGSPSVLGSSGPRLTGH